MNNDLYTKRDQFLIDIRKQETMEHINKSRKRIYMGLCHNPNLQITKQETQDRLNEYKRDIDFAFSNGKTSGLSLIVQNIRFICSSDENYSPVNEFLNAGLRDYFIDFLTEKYDNIPEIQSNAQDTWYNIFVADFEKITPIIENTPIIDNTIRFLCKGKIRLFTAAVGILRNIIGDNDKQSFVIRENFLLNGIVGKVISEVNSFEQAKVNQTMSEEVCETHFTELSNTTLEFFASVLQGPPYLDSQFLDVCKSIISYCAKHILNDNENSSEALWCIVFFLQSATGRVNDTLNERVIYTMQQEGMEKRLIYIFTDNETKNTKISMPLIKIISFVAQTEETRIIENFINADIASLFIQCLSPNQNLYFFKTTGICALTNIFCSHALYIKELLMNGELMCLLIQSLQSEHLGLKIELAYCFRNIINCFSFQVQNSFFQKFDHIFYENFLGSLDPDSSPHFQIPMLENFESLQKIGKINSDKDQNLIQNRFLDNDCENLDKLQAHSNQIVYIIISRIIEQYFPYDDVE